MDPEVRKRPEWINLYLATKDAGLTCRKCGISSLTLRKWLQRYQEHGLTGLISQSRRLLHSPVAKVQEEQEAVFLNALEKGKMKALEDLVTDILRSDGGSWNAA